MIRWILYPLAIFFTVSLVANLAERDWSEALLMLGLLATSALMIGLLEWRTSTQMKRWKSDMEALRGLDKCPISQEHLFELFEFLDRPDPPPCTHRLSETFGFLQSRGLEIESTLKRLNANGAGCDCEVIFNTAQRYGPDVGFEPIDDEDEPAGS